MTKHSWRGAALAVVGLTLAAPARGQAPAGDRRFQGLDEYVAALMRQWKVPGLSIAVVRADSVLLVKGYGVRTVGGSTPVDAHTVFAIGSATKAFTGAAIEMLADDGKLGVDRPVTTYLPWFELSDPWVTREITVRDLLLHRSGLPGSDQIWYGTTRSREDVVRSLRWVTPTSSFRSRFQYQNLMYVTAGEIVRAVTGSTWDDFVRDRILTPLGMTESNTTIRALPSLPNVATPHAELGGTVRPVPWRSLDVAAAAGAVNSTALDLTKWLRLWVGRGAFEGRRLLSERAVREATRPQFMIESQGFLTRLMSPPYLGYGFGWFVEPFRGRTWVNHGGNIDGMAALVSLIPEENVGIAILTNLNESDVTFPLTANLLDRVLGYLPAKDYDPEYRRSVEARRGPREPEPVPPRDTHPSLPLPRYAGIYRNDLYGTATVWVEKTGALAVRYDANPTAIGDLAHRSYDSFVATMRDPMLGTVPVSFRLDAEGNPAGMVFGIDGPVEWRREAGGAGR